jgi:hypothetical protein
MFLLLLLLIHLQADLHLCCNYVNTTTKNFLPTSLLARLILKSRKKFSMRDHLHFGKYAIQMTKL